MARNQSRDPLVLSPHWHVDCRLPAELPDDRVVVELSPYDLSRGRIVYRYK